MEKEGELRKLKSELSELDRKISLTINKNKEEDNNVGLNVETSNRKQQK